MTADERRPRPRPRRDPNLHPRMRARRIEVRRDEGRRRRLRLAIVAAVLAVVALAVVVIRSPILDVDRVQVAGTVRTTPAEVRKAAGIRPGAAMVDLDTGSIAKRVEARPWVARVTVQRRWPSTVEVRVTEREPVAQARAGTRWAVLDRTGRVVTVGRTPQPDLVEVTGVDPGPPGSSVGRREALDVAAALGARLGAEAGRIRRGSDGLDLVLRNGVVVHLGSVDQLDDKLVALDAILTKAVPDPPIATIDVRVPSSPVLTRAGNRS
ncbi:MAG: FtsQ-type POTRA domain-containing protein [Acidimicrobiia bacterium]|nr:FtsQ-type POTRA domain-containing protein [Acidimicrobiia bacterium]